MSEHTTPPRGPDARSEASASERRDAERSSGRLKRAAAGVLGGVLVVTGLRRRSLSGTVAATAGAGLLAWALGETDRIERAVESRTTIGADTETSGKATSSPSATRSITVDRPAEELHEVWRDPQQLSKIMGHFATVVSAGEDRLRWSADGPRGRRHSWETFIVEDEPGEVLRWETPPDATIPNEGTVRFRSASGDRGTVVTLSVSFEPPGGAVGTAVLKRLDVVPEALVATALDRFKSLVESDEIPTLSNNPSGRGAGDLA